MKYTAIRSQYRNAHAWNSVVKQPGTMISFIGATLTVIGGLLWLTGNDDGRIVFIVSALIVSLNYIRLFSIWLYEILVMPHRSYINVREVKIGEDEIGLFVDDQRYTKIGIGGIAYIKWVDGIWKIGFKNLLEMQIDEKQVSDEEKDMLHNLQRKIAM